MKKLLMTQSVYIELLRVTQPDTRGGWIDSNIHSIDTSGAIDISLVLA